MGFFSRITQGLSKTATGLTDALRGVAGLPHGRVDAATLAELEDALLLADVGVEMTTHLIDDLRAARFAENATAADIRQWLQDKIAAILAPCAQPFPVPQATPEVILFVGVNGSGKTTTIGKLAAQWGQAGQKLLLAAGDTYRAGAAEQLAIWAERAHVPLVQADKPQADPAGLIYQAYQQAQAMGCDRLICDTAGRLQNRTDLMEQLTKIRRVLQKHTPAAPHHTLLVLDATVGQNALQQVKVFQEMAAVSGLIITKLDGSAKAGVVLALAETCKLPIYFIGVGEKLDDLQPFDAAAFAAGLVGMTDEA